ncbi:MAG: NAD(P)-dependent oxidoreductase [Clostridia bacterium]|nr:NAD(P)-dependent oxidoreductase [Clostridia bacterium]
MQAAIVTGASGMIASALIRNLIQKGVKVYALCKPGEGKNDEFFNSPLVRAIDVDISRLEDAYEKIGEKCDVLYHFAWLGTFGGIRDDAYLQNDNIKYTLDAVALAHKTGCTCFVGAGSQAEYGSVTEKLTAKTPTAPTTGYGIAKLAAGNLSRLYAQNLNIRHIWVRILSVYGQKGNPNAIIPSSIAKLAKGEHCPFTPAEQDWDFMHCDDVAEAFYLIGEKGRDGAIYPLGTGSTRKLKDYITELRDIVNKDATVGIGELPYNKNQVMYLCADISELTADTGFVSSISFEEGVKRTFEWMKEQG